MKLVKPNNFSNSKEYSIKEGDFKIGDILYIPGSPGESSAELKITGYDKDRGYMVDVIKDAMIGELFGDEYKLLQYLNHGKGKLPSVPLTYYIPNFEYKPKEFYLKKKNINSTSVDDFIKELKDGDKIYVRNKRKWLSFDEANELASKDHLSKIDLDWVRYYDKDGKEINFSSSTGKYKGKYIGDKWVISCPIQTIHFEIDFINTFELFDSKKDAEDTLKYYIEKQKGNYKVPEVEIMTFEEYAESVIGG